MLTILIINAHAIILISSQTTLPTIEREGYANVQQWYDGTLVYAHNYLAGGEFFEAEIVTAIYADGYSKSFEVSRTAIVANEDWSGALLEYSKPETLTLATCYGTGSVFLAELVEAEITKDVQ